ncbi:MAG: hypothetical protein HRT45_17820 [Bdellovibrionales bacterium]|nr:hypothetical protein [Bdellovibrionales bacterium]
MGRTVLSLALIAGVFAAEFASANSCCGQGPASFSVLAMQQRLVMSTGVSAIEAQGRVLGEDNDFFLWPRKRREIRSARLNLASAFADRQQVFLNTAWMQGSYSDSEESGEASSLSDTLVGYTYEVLPEYSFNWWKPNLFVTALVNLPTGHSIYDRTELSEGADVTGHGQWGAGLGVTLRKVYFPLTLTLQLRAIQLIPERFERAEVESFVDSSLALMAGYATRLWGVQLNTGITQNHLSERRAMPIPRGARLMSAGVSQNSTVLLGLQKAIDEQWSVGLNYSDQTLIGPAVNSILNRGVSLNLDFQYF